jgi:hypothetical protein
MQDLFSYAEGVAQHSPGLPRPFAATLGSENGFVSYPERVAQDVGLGLS